MNTVVETINAAGGAFVDFALPMLVQSSVLFVILLAIDAVLRRRVRAVFRYWIWMLVLVKLLLPPSLWSPVSVGRWLGDPLKAPTVALFELGERRPAGPAAEPRFVAASVLSQDIPAPVVAPVAPVENPYQEAAYPHAGMQPDSALADMDSESLPGTAAVPFAGPSLTWQGLVLLSWAAVAISLLLLLLQRSFFVRGLVAQADEASAAMQDSLNQCRARIGLRREVTLRLSAITGSPAACGLIHPVILIPQSLAPRLEAHDLQAVLLHELAHVKRGDLWVNLAQTLVQIVYFYNPLLWLANMMIRRTREQAVDEAVLVALGDTAQQYPETLVNIAKLAFRKRPALSLRLVGVVESKSALSGRIKHILTRPLPKTARLGLLGFLAIIIVGVLLLPMACGQLRSDVAPSPLAVASPSGDVDLPGVVAPDRGDGGDAPVESANPSRSTQGGGEVPVRASLEGVGPAPGEAAAKLANGVTVRFMAYSRLTEDGLKWWTASNDPTNIPGVYEADVDGLGTVLAFEVSPPDCEVYAHTYRGSEKDIIKKSWRLPNTSTWLFALGEQRNFTNVEVSTGIVEPPVVGLIPLTGADQGKVVEVGKFGVAQIVDLQVLSTGTRTSEPGAEPKEFPQYGRPVGLRESRPVIQFTSIQSPGSYPRVVALWDKEGLTHQVAKVSGDARATTYEAYILPDRLAAVVVETSPAYDSKVRFRNLSLTPGHTTTVQVETDPQPQTAWVPSKAGSAVRVLVDGLEQYQNDHGGRLPASLRGMEAYLPDDNWLLEHVTYISKGGLLTNEPNVPIAYDKTLLPQGKGAYVIYDDRRIQFESPKRLAQLGIAAPDGRGATPGDSRQETVARKSVDDAKPPVQQADTLKRLLDEAPPGGTVVIPKGRCTVPIEVTKPLVLRGESQKECIIEVTADQPAVLINTGGKGEVTLENVTIQWQLATDQRTEQAAAVWVKGTNASIRNCRFVPLGDYKRSPMAVYIDGRSKSTVDNCRFSGFDFVLCYGPGTEGVVQDCIITDCGHQGVINYDGATLTVQRNIIVGSQFHAVRCTGGTLHVKDNLLMKNANRGIYLGNKTGRGTITNNLIVGNGTGISGFGRADYAIANNVIVNNDYAGIDMRDSCRLSIRNNVLAKNQRSIALHKEGTENFNVIAKNAYSGNATDVENLDKPAGSVTADPQFADPNRGDFSVRGPVREQGHGLTNPSVIRELWEKYRQLPRSELIESTMRQGVQDGFDMPPAQWRQMLLTGDSNARRVVFEGIRQRRDIMTVLDASFLPAMRAAATDGNASVRNEVACAAKLRGKEQSMPSRV